MLLKNEKGFSIIQGLMLAGLLAGTALVTSQLVSDQKKASVSARSKDAVDELGDLAYNLLQFQDNCRQTIIGNGAQTSPFTGAARNLTHLYSHHSGNTGRQVFSIGKSYFGNSVSITSMTVDYKAGNISNLNPAVIEIKMRRNDASDATTRTKDGYGGKDFSKKIDIIVKRTNAGAFETCYAVKGANSETGELGNIDQVKTICESYLDDGFTWNSTYNYCEYTGAGGGNSRCPTGQFFMGINSNGLAAITDVDNVVTGEGGIPVNWMWTGRKERYIASVGAAECRAPFWAILIQHFIDETSVNCINRPGVRFIKIGNKVRIGCD